VLDSVRERRPRFSPDAVAEEFAGTLRAYGLSQVTGDAYGGLWPREAFARHGITYTVSAKNKSELYLALVPGLNAGRVQLLDLPTLRAQLVALERRVARSGKESVDHPAGGDDDVANASAGALVLALPGSGLEARELPAPVSLEQLSVFGERSWGEGLPTGFGASGLPTLL